MQHRRQAVADMADKGLVRAEEEMERCLEPEAAALEQMADRRVGGEPERLRLGQVADMVGAAGAGRLRARPSRRRARAHPDARRAGERPHDPREGDRPVHAAAPFEARAEIVDLGNSAVGVGEPGHQDRRVLEVALRRRNLVVERDPPQAADRRLRLEQGAEQGIAVDPRHAGPDQAGRIVDQGADLAIADRPEIEIAHKAAWSQSATALTDSSR